MGFMQKEILEDLQEFVKTLGYTSKIEYKFANTGRFYIKRSQFDIIGIITFDFQDTYGNLTLKIENEYECHINASNVSSRYDRFKDVLKDIFPVINKDLKLEKFLKENGVTKRQFDLIKDYITNNK